MFFGKKLHLDLKIVRKWEFLFHILKVIFYIISHVYEIVNYSTLQLPSLEANYVRFVFIPKHTLSLSSSKPFHM